MALICLIAFSFYVNNAGTTVCAHPVADTILAGDADLDDDGDEPECLEPDIDACSTIIVLFSTWIVDLISSAAAIILPSW